MEDIEVTINAIRNLLDTQRFGSLATLNEQGIHSTLVAYSQDSSLLHVYFCTSTTTRKYENLRKHQQVSLLIHNSTNKDEDLTGAQAVTITGTARIVTDTERAESQQILQEKHQYLKEIMDSPEVAYIVIDVQQYDLVTNFQDVRTITVSREEL